MILGTSNAPLDYHSVGPYDVVGYTVVEVGQERVVLYEVYDKLHAACSAFHSWHGRPTKTNGGLIRDANQRVILHCWWPPDAVRPGWWFSHEALRTWGGIAGAEQAIEAELMANGVFE